MARVSYAWARHVDVANIGVDALSDNAHDGYQYALLLAEDGYETSRNLPRRLELGPFRIEQIATRERLPAETIEAWIALARQELFADLSDAAIYKRAQRQRGRKPRTCAEQGCNAVIPTIAPANKLYCDRHAAPAARIARSRRQRARSLV